MTAIQTRLGNDPQFEPFLTASVGLDQRGGTVTVMSMLARLGVDPWREAAALADLSMSSATTRLAERLSAFRDVQIGEADRAALSARILPLLPRNPRAATPEPHGQQPGQPLSLARLTAIVPGYFWIAAVGLCAILLMNGFGN
ncbi:hypothetical protein FDP22_00210 [Paroceanicella profunda]|uniref:Uncharacterized protein n=1 Tax=Paroceanicella profunda TaxID=2579971 RepID=A0A5B8FV69_9RHOB|nr:hypothetical protein [Paroceanicella profunda]QDL90359.1 hypothetical protein FDP22_00210 [Paroceanicella profunda]